MNHLDYVNTYVFFAWYPVNTINNGWTWLKKVYKTVDERPEVYSGLLAEIIYKSID